MVGGTHPVGALRHNYYCYMGMDQHQIMLSPDTNTEPHPNHSNKYMAGVWLTQLWTTIDPCNNSSCSSSKYSKYSKYIRSRIIHHPKINGCTNEHPNSLTTRDWGPRMASQRYHWPIALQPCHQMIICGVNPPRPRHHEPPWFKQHH